MRQIRRALQAFLPRNRARTPRRVRVILNEANGFGRVDRLRGPVDELPVGAGLPPTPPASTGSHARYRWSW